MDGLQPMERKAPVYLNGLTQRAPDPRQSASGPWWWGLRVFKQSAWLEVGSVKMAWSRPAYQRVTPTVRRQRVAIRQSILKHLTMKEEIPDSNIFMMCEQINEHALT